MLESEILEQLNRGAGRQVGRRQFLAAVGLGGAAALLAACSQASPSSTGSSGAATSATSAAGASATKPAGTTAPAAAGSTTKINFGQTGITSSQWNFYVAQDKGIYAKHGLDVNFITGDSAQTVYQQVIAGATQYGTTGLPQGILAVQGGAKIRMVNSCTTVPAYRIAAAKDVKTWSDLKGKTISLGGPDDVTYYFWKLLIDKQNMQLNDFKYVWAGATTARYAALKSNSVAATMLLQPFDFQAQSEGYPILGSLTDVLKPSDYIFTGGWVRTDWAASHGDAIVNLIRAQNEGTAWLTDPANETEAKAILLKYVKTTQDLANKTYDLIIKGYGFFPKDGSMPDQAINNVISSLTTIGALKGTISASAFVDKQYLQKAGTA